MIKKIDIELCSKSSSHGERSNEEESEDEESYSPSNLDKRDDNEKMQYIQRKYHEVLFENVEYTEHKAIQMDYEIEKRKKQSVTGSLDDS